MDAIHKILNVVFPFASIILLIVFVPVFWLFDLLRFCLKSCNPEDLTGKVILITGASAGIGEVTYIKNEICMYVTLLLKLLHDHPLIFI